MPRIGIDVRMAHHTGIGRYIRGFVSELGETSWSRSLIGKPDEQKVFPREKSFIPFGAPIYSLREQILLPFAARTCDALHVPHYTAPLMWSKKLIVTIHDLIHLEFSKDLNPVAVRYAQFFLASAAKRSDAIITVSEHTKKDLIEKLNVKAEKITVIYHGVDPIFLKPESNSESAEKHPYFLCVGLIKSHKNLGVALKAFIQVKKRLSMPDLRLRIVGRPDRKQKIVNEWLKLAATDSGIEFMNFVPDEELRKLYANSAALIFPSRYEGFGFPLLEAMASRTPVIASHSTSIPEVLGNAGLYFDPDSQSELERLMEQILTKNNLRQELIKKGLSRLKLFSWQESAKKHVEIYGKVINVH